MLFINLSLVKACKLCSNHYCKVISSLISFKKSKIKFVLINNALESLHLIKYLGKLTIQKIPIEKKIALYF